MKNKFIAIIFLATTIVAFSSCAASRNKYGCPGSFHSTKFNK